MQASQTTAGRVSEASRFASPSGKADRHADNQPAKAEDECRRQHQKMPSKAFSLWSGWLVTGSLFLIW